MRALPLVAPLLVSVVACTDGRDSGALETEALIVPDDPAVAGMPVGVRTIEVDGVTIELWYPATDDVAGQSGEIVDFAAAIPSSVTDRVGPVEVTPVPTAAIRDAPPRRLDAPVPAIVFSHGFAGTRLQSPDYTVHLASRGYVVAAADHPGRRFQDLVPCVFGFDTPGCNLGNPADDPALDQVPVVVSALDGLAASGDLAGLIDTDRLGMSGHSAGGGTTEAMGDLEPRFDALLSLAAPAAPTRDVPTLLMDGTCDGIIPTESVDEAFDVLPSGQRVRVRGAGHLAFSDLCALEFERLADEVLGGRDDVNQTLVEQFVGLGTDGCPGIVPTVQRTECADGFLPLETSAPIIRHMSTVFFDQQLKGEGSGVQDGVFSEVEAIP